jgi:cytochrome P450
LHYTGTVDGKRGVHVGSVAKKLPIQVICAWCGRHDDAAAQSVANVAKVGAAVDWQPATPISHTICERCFARERVEVERIVRASRNRTSA